MCVCIYLSIYIYLYIDICAYRRVLVRLAERFAALTRGFAGGDPKPSGSPAYCARAEPTGLGGPSAAMEGRAVPIGADEACERSRSERVRAGTAGAGMVLAC